MMAPPKKAKAKPEPDYAELPDDPLAEQVKRHAASIESILALLRHLAPALPGLSLDPGGVDQRIGELKNPGGRRAGELLNEDE